MLRIIPNVIPPCFEWEEIGGEHFCDAPGAIRLCVYYLAKVDKWHFAAWRDDMDGYLHDSNNIEDRSGFVSIETAKSAAEHYGRHPVIAKPGKKAS